MRKRNRSVLIAIIGLFTLAFVIAGLSAPASATQTNRVISMENAENPQAPDAITLEDQRRGVHGDYTYGKPCEWFGVCGWFKNGGTKKIKYTCAWGTWSGKKVKFAKMNKKTRCTDADGLFIPNGYKLERWQNRAGGGAWIGYDPMKPNTHVTKKGKWRAFYDTEIKMKIRLISG